MMLLCAGTVSAAPAGQTASGDDRDLGVPLVRTEALPSGPVEVARGGTSIQMDNDLFSIGNSDRDYTFGVATTFATPRSNLLVTPVDSIRRRLHELLPGSVVDGSVTLRSTQVGMLGMTPDDLTASDAQPDDRPYASLLYLATFQIEVSGDAERAATAASLSARSA